MYYQAHFHAPFTIGLVSPPLTSRKTPSMVACPLGTTLCISPAAYCGPSLRHSVANKFTGTLPTVYGAWWSLMNSFRVDSNSLVGTLPSAYSAWGSSLSVFTCDSNALSGTIPVEYELWSNLTQFYVAINQLNGSLPRRSTSMPVLWKDISVFGVAHNQLQGTLPEEYSGWSSLSSFVAGANTLTGSVPASYSRWGRLKVFGVGGNQLSGTVPLFFDNWTMLTTFDISSNSFSGSLPRSSAPGVSSNVLWPSLEYFSVATNSFTGTIVPEYSQWAHLTFFSVAQNSLSGTLPPQLSQWGASLREFIAATNLLSGSIPPSYASNWTSLERFDVFDNRLSGALPDVLSPLPSGGVMMWPNMNYFHSGTNLFTGTIPIRYASWTRLSLFAAWQNSLTGTLSPLFSEWGSSMQWFAVGDNAIAGSIPETFKNWTSLQRFDASMNSLSGTLPRIFGQCWKSLLTFSVANNGLTGNIPSEYGNWTELTSFDVSQNEFIGTIPSTFASWRKALATFSVAQNFLTGSIPVDISSWSQLQSFDAGGNMLSGTLAPEFGDWGNTMVTFSIGQNMLSGAVPPNYLIKWTKLESFNVSLNRLTGTLPPSSTTTLLVFDASNNFISSSLPSSYALSWTQLHVFDVSNNSITGTLDPSFKNWVLLRHFNVSHNMLSGTLPAEYGDGWKSLLSFRAGNNQLAGSLPPQYAGWTRIDVIDGFANKLTGSIPEAWGDSMKMLTTLFLYSNDLSGTLPLFIGALPMLSYVSLAANPQLAGTLPAAWGARGGTSLSLQPFVLLWLQNTSVSGPIPSTWAPSMFNSMFLLFSFSICGTQLCGPAPASFVMTSICFPDTLLRTEISFSNLGNNAVPIVPVDFALEHKCPTNTTATPSPRGNGTNNVSLPYKPSSRQLTSVAKVITGPLGGAVAAVIGAAPLALGIYRSSSLSRIVSCGGAGVEDGNNNNASDHNTLSGLPSFAEVDGGALDDLVRLTAGHLIALGSCVVLAALALSGVAMWKVNRKDASIDGHDDQSTALVGALKVLHLPGRFSMVAATVGPPLWEFGIALLLLRSERTLGGVASVSGAALLLLVAAVVIVLSPCGYFHARFVRTCHRASSVAPPHHDHHLHRAILSWWHSAAAQYDKNRSGEWLDTKRDVPFLAHYGDVFEELTGSRRWYVAVQCALAGAIGAISAISDAIGVDPTAVSDMSTSSMCSIVQIAASILNMGQLVALIVLRPYRSASSMAIDCVVELFGFLGGLLIFVAAVVGGDDDDDDDGSTSVADAAATALTIQFWLAIAIAVLQGLLAAVAYARAPTTTSSRFTTSAAIRPGTIMPPHDHQRKSVNARAMKYLPKRLFSGGTEKESDRNAVVALQHKQLSVLVKAICAHTLTRRKSNHSRPNR
ncbi:GP46-like surface antigen, putative [Bodo saltans]|uniref:GP46-like surface antigen, putative n=1 Tax=Bodo saltans TaxID=75058 RepID=A0A0S4ILT2_BODSA|nr:GP46-like surface antigen, putative [Bodo saltans]|eukprot:CUF32306.1 GP46-like surface antigen, putative [Bodo saltans]